MIGYTTIGTNDLEKSTAFYDALLELVGGKQIMDGGRIVFYGNDQGGAMLALCTPFDKADPAPGNGVMIAIPGGSPEGADALYKKAIELGATDEGEPGQRIPIFYGGYVRDLDGNKITFYHMTPAA